MTAHMPDRMQSAAHFARDAPRALTLAHRDCAEPNPFYADHLLAPALADLTDDAQVRQIIAKDANGREIGRLPVTTHRRHGRFPVAHSANWVHRHCFYGAPLLRAGQEDAAWQALLAELDIAPWAGRFLHLRGYDPHAPAGLALARLCARQGRSIEIIETRERALLSSTLDADAYWTATVRSKKRKELRRLQYRLAEEGEIVRRALGPADDLDLWVDDFLAVERSGWKGEGGTALGSQEADARFFRAACAGARAAGELEMLRIDCDARPIAMLVNFIGPLGGFSFKIAIDPAFARYSPGVLIEQDNLVRVLDEKAAPWMDSCAATDHPMIDSLWAERRTIAQCRVALGTGGMRSMTNRAALGAMRLAEAGYARVKKVKNDG